MVHRYTLHVTRKHHKHFSSPAPHNHPAGVAGLHEARGTRFIDEPTAASCRRHRSSYRGRVATLDTLDGSPRPRRRPARLVLHQGPAAGSRCQKATSTRDEHRAARSGTRLVRHVGCTHSTGPSRPGQCGHDEKLQVRRRESLRPRPLPSRLPLASGLRKAARAARPSSARGTTSTHARVEAW